MFKSKIDRNGFVINSLLNNDFYKFTMGNYFFEKCQNDIATYEFKCRNKIDLTPFISEIEKEIDHLQTLKFTEDEIKVIDSKATSSDEDLDYFKSLAQ